MQVDGMTPQMNQLLVQMRALRDSAQNGLQPAAKMELDQARASDPVRLAQSAPAPSFSAVLNGAVAQVNDLQQTSSRTTNGFVLGQHKDLVKVMVDSQKASLGFQGLLQARNRMVSAYQDIMNMPI